MHKILRFLPISSVWIRDIPDQMALNRVENYEASYHLLSKAIH